MKKLSFLVLILILIITFQSVSLAVTYNWRVLPDIANAPTSVWWICFSSDATYLITAGTPGCAIFKRSGDTFTKLVDEPEGGEGQGRSCSISADDNYLALGDDTDATFLGIFKRTGDNFDRLDDPATGPTDAVYAVSFSSDATYLAVGQIDQPYLMIYKRSGDVFTKLADPAYEPPGGVYGLDFSSDDTYLAVACGLTPYIVIYKRSGDTFTRLANEPDTIPTDWGRSIRFSSNDIYLALGWNSSPYIYIYKRSGDDFNKLANEPDTALTGAGRSASFPSDDSYLAATCYQSSPYVHIYKRTADNFDKIDNLYTHPGGLLGVPCDFSPDGIYLAIEGADINLLVYKKGGIATPTGFTDPDSKWLNETNAYDKSLTSYIEDDNGGGYYVEFSLSSAINCDKVRVWCAEYKAGDLDADIDIDVYYSTAWHNIFTGLVNHTGWAEKEIGSTQSVDKMRIKFNDIPGGGDARIYEVEFNEVEVAGWTHKWNTQTITKWNTKEITKWNDLE